MPQLKLWQDIVRTIPYRGTWKEDQSYLKRHVVSKLSGRLAVSLVTADFEAIGIFV
jgi:hypothetical protein